MKKDKKELIGKIETVEADIKKKVEMETNATRFVQGPYTMNSDLPPLPGVKVVIL